ncbi:MAG: enoyl-CoA hydratase/isomerase family protein [Flavobacteriales bacterium]
MALYFALTGKSMDAQTALSYGIISEVYPLENLLNAVHQIAITLTKMPRESMSGIIASCNASEGDKSGYAIESECFERCVDKSDFREGVNAFLEKRTAVFD